MNVRIVPLLFAVLVCTALAFSTATASENLLVEQVAGWQIPEKPVDIVQAVDGSAIFVLTEQHNILIYEPNGRLKGTFKVDPGVTAIDVDARGEIILLVNGNDQTFSALTIDFISAINTAGSPVLGNPEAPVTIAVFTDFE
jgi:protein-disulfide isomerase